MQQKHLKNRKKESPKTLDSLLPNTAYPCHRQRVILFFKEEIREIKKRDSPLLGTPNNEVAFILLILFQANGRQMLVEYL